MILKNSKFIKSKTLIDLPRILRILQRQKILVKHQSPQQSQLCPIHPHKNNPQAQQPHPNKMLHPLHPIIQTLLQQVNSIYQHPLHYTYVLHKTDGLLHLYDQTTMDIVGKTKVIVLDQMKLFAFTNDFNMFYGLRECRFLIFELSSSQWLAHIPIDSGQEVKPYFEAYYLCYFSRKQLLICVTTTSFYLVSPVGGTPYRMAPQLKYEDTVIHPEKVAEISGLTWIVGYKNAIYYVRFSQNFDTYEIYDKITTGPIVRLSIEHHPKREYIYVITESHQVLLIRVNQRQRKLHICFKFLNENYLPQYVTLLRLGINTSTTDKLRNRIYICVYAQLNSGQRNEQKIRKMTMMVDQKEEQQKVQSSGGQNSMNAEKKYCMLIIPTDAQDLTDFEKSKACQENFTESQQFSLQPLEQTYIVKDMPQLKASPWINILQQNCLLFLTTKNQVCYINFCSIPQLNLKADQWICMGYKFQMLEKNQVYEEREDQFEDETEKGMLFCQIQEEKCLSKEFLDDWSQSNLTKSAVIYKAYNRIRSIDL